MNIFYGVYRFIIIYNCTNNTFIIIVFNYYLYRSDIGIKSKSPFFRIFAIYFSPTESNQLPLKERCTLNILRGSKRMAKRTNWKQNSEVNYINNNFRWLYNIKKYIFQQISTYFQTGIFPNVYVQEHSSVFLKIFNLIIICFSWNPCFDSFTTSVRK